MVQRLGAKLEKYKEAKDAARERIAELEEKVAATEKEHLDNVAIIVIYSTILE